MEYFVVLIAALFHAVWNSMIKDSGDKLLSLTVIRTVGFIFGLLVVFLFPPLSKDAVPYLVIAAAIHFLYFWFLLNTYRVGDFSQVYPISRGTAPLIVLVLGALFAGEHLSRWQVSAILMISVGTLMLSVNRGRLTAIPVGYALGTACCIAGYTVVSGMGVRVAGSFLTYAGWLEAMCGTGVILFTFFKRESRFLSGPVHSG